LFLHHGELSDNIYISRVDGMLRVITTARTVPNVPVELDAIRLRKRMELVTYHERSEPGAQSTESSDSATILCVQTFYARFDLNMHMIVSPCSVESQAIVCVLCGCLRSCDRGFAAVDGGCADDESARSLEHNQASD